MSTFQDICTLPRPEKYQQHGLRKFTVKEDEGLTGILEATNSNDRYKTVAVNKRELDDLNAAKRSGRLARAVVVAVAYRNGRWVYLGEMEAEKLESHLAEVQPLNGQHGPFWSIDQYLFASNAPF
jgi:hypothetical protein